MGLLSKVLNRFKKVLIVEDDAALRGALADKFRMRGYKVVEAGDAHDALTLVGTEQPDAMVLDLILPIKDGISLLEELRASQYQLPVIILSNLLGSGDLRTDAERLDASFYNKSSTSLDDVVQAVEQRL